MSKISAKPPFICSWVMLSDDKRSFTPLVGEQQLYCSPPRTTLSVNTKYTSGTESDNFSVDSGAGVVFLTNRRVYDFKSKDIKNDSNIHIRRSYIFRQIRHPH